MNPYTGEIKPEHLLSEEEKKVFVPIPDAVIIRAGELLDDPPSPMPLTKYTNRKERRKLAAFARKS